MKAFFVSLIARIMEAFLYTRLGQWVSRKVTGGWCFIRKDDPRFIVTVLAHSLKYSGDPNAAPDQGISEQRQEWKTWIIFRVPPIFSGHSDGHVVIDIHNGQRMVYLGLAGRVMAIRVGHEPGLIRLGLDCEDYLWRNAQPGSMADQFMTVAPLHPDLRPVFLARWNESEEWPTEAVGRPKDQVTFI